MKGLKIWAAILLFVVGIGAAPAPARAQAGPAPRSDDADVAALRLEVERLRREVEALQSELRLMREFMLERLAQPSRPSASVEAKVALGDSPMLGKGDAPLTLVEFSDYQCPYSGRFAETTLPTLKRDYVEGGRLRYVFHDFPLDRLHPQARKAAEAARCAGEQGRYWEMHDVLFQHQQGLQSEQLRDYAEQLGLDGTAFAACLDSGKYQAVVQREYTEGLALGVRGTSSFVLGKTRADNTVEGVLFTGARPLDEFRQAMDRLLTGK